MEQIYSNNTRKIIENKKLIENTLKVKLNINGKVIAIEGKAEDEFLALQFIEAINLGFSINKALNIKEEDFIFIKIPIKAIATRKNLAQVRARVIGAKRKALNTIESLCDCKIVLHNNLIGIIGHTDSVKKAEYSLQHIIAGSKHSAMYGWLEKKKLEEKQSF